VAGGAVSKPPSCYQVFKALNTVLAFCSARKHMATTFHGIRSSVESMLRRWVTEVF
jgi:DEAD/DEAH box helicase domain-containing protein